MNISNPFKKALAQGQRQHGMWLSLAHPYSAEVCATAGFDWLLIDGEHAPFDMHNVLAQLQAVAAYASHPVVRPPVGDTALIKQLLDIGAQSLLIPMVDTAEQARSLVAAVRYPPHGIRGVGSALARASRWNLVPDYLEQANGNICLLVQAESVAALRNLEEICAVDGVDGVFIGPADLAASMGHLGNAGHPEVQAAIEQAIRTIVASGKSAGTLTREAAAAQRYFDLGCTFVSAGTDVLLLAQAARANASEMAAARRAASQE